MDDGDIKVSAQLENIYSYYEALSVRADTLTGNLQFNIDVSGNIVAENGLGFMVMGALPKATPL